MSTADEGGLQVLLYLLRRCHGLIYRLIAESEPISEELMPIVSSPVDSLHDKSLMLEQPEGQQAVHCQEMFERGAQIRWPVQRS